MMRAILLLTIILLPTTSMAKVNFVPVCPTGAHLEILDTPQRQKMRANLKDFSTQEDSAKQDTKTAPKDKKRSKDKQEKNIPSEAEIAERQRSMQSTAEQLFDEEVRNTVCIKDKPTPQKYYR